VVQLGRRHFSLDAIPRLTVYVEEASAIFGRHREPGGMSSTPTTRPASLIPLRAEASTRRFAK